MSTPPQPTTSVSQFTPNSNPNAHQTLSVVTNSETNNMHASTSNMPYNTDGGNDIHVHRANENQITPNEISNGTNNTANSTQHAMHPGNASGHSENHSNIIGASALNSNTGNNGVDWRDKEADRSARQQIARIILQLIVKSANRPAAANYQPKEIARRLEHTLYMNAPSLESYRNTDTLRARLQHALDTSRKRQQRQLQQQQQQRQQNLLQQQQPIHQQHLSVSAVNQHMVQHQPHQQELVTTPNYQPIPFSPVHQISKNNMPGMPLGTASVAVSSARPISATISSTSSGANTNSSIGTSILDELDRETDEMANGVSDMPIAMPVSELSSSLSSGHTGLIGPSSSVSTTSSYEVNVLTPTSDSADVNNLQYNQVQMPISMPPEISAGLINTVGSNSSAYQQQSIPQGMVPTSGTFQGMSLANPQILQLQQQMEHIRRMQLQHIQLRKAAAVNSVNINTSIGNGILNGNSTHIINSGTNGASTAPNMMNEASIAQKREELKRRLIQLKHARTCTSSECNINYCSRTKELLNHVSHCSNAECAVGGCKSTRQLLSHFRKCRNLRCDVCGVIRPPMDDREQQLVLKRQQERLCMLRHASTCSTSKCVLPYCANMKLLWKHICECSKRDCGTDHCISSRYVLSHFKQCSKMICEVCGPVRKAIKTIDACGGKAETIQMAISQSPEAVQSLIKIMNSTVFPQHGQPPDGIPGQHNNMKSESGKLESAGASNNALVQGSLAGLKSPLGNDISVLDEGSQDLKKKPLKLQTEKEKKQRRKAQADIAKARKKLRDKATRADVLGISASNGLKSNHAAVLRAVTLPPQGLVVRGTSKTILAKDFSHQDISYLDSMSESQLDEHIRSLRFNFCGHITLTDLKNRLMPLLSRLMESEHGWAFNNPVDPIQWNIPDYFEIIQCPMDLGTIKKRLDAEHYNSVDAFAGDVRLVFENCIAYNSSTNKFNIAAKQLLNSFNKSLEGLKAQLEKQLFKRCEQRREEMCQLCGGESFKFAPCMLFCSGPCGGRIRRHTHYYSDIRGEHHWCSSCYKQMKDGPIDMSTLPQLSTTPAAETSSTGASGSAGGINIESEGVLTKESLIKRKNSEVAEEPWVECDSCKLWYHQICALFNERNHAISGEQEPFVCPICVKKQRSSGIPPSLETGLKAKRLPITRMAKLIEQRVLEAIKKAHRDEALRMGNMGNSDSIGFSNGVEESTSATQYSITIREVLSVDKQVQIKPKMGRLLASKLGKPKNEKQTSSPRQSKSLKRPRSSGEAKKQNRESPDGPMSASTLKLTYRSRCICVFQELDGVDVLIFTLYVQEYDKNCLDANAGRVYVSYLDSVSYFQPKKLRTLMHQQVMLGFLEDCKNRGFHTCHIWSCPPLKGDDYIFFCKPENQKIPKSARLRQWYQKILNIAKKQGLVVHISNLYNEYYMRKKAAHELPYFEGDYWPRLAEDLIKQMEEKASGVKNGGNNSGQKSAASSKSATGNNVPTTPGQVDSTYTTPGSSPINDNIDVGTDSGIHSKNSKTKKSKRELKSSSTTSELATRSSTKSRSKKGQVSSRASSALKNAINPDPLMQKLKPILEPQKEDFFVIDLHPKCHKCTNPIIDVDYWLVKTCSPPAEVQEVLDLVKKIRVSSTSSRNNPPRHYTHYFCEKCYEVNKTQIQHRIELADAGAKRTLEIASKLRQIPLLETTPASQISDLDLQEMKFSLCLSHIKPTDNLLFSQHAKAQQDIVKPTIEIDSVSEANAHDHVQSESDSTIPVEKTENENVFPSSEKKIDSTTEPSSCSEEAKQSSEKITVATTANTSSEPNCIVKVEPNVEISNQTETKMDDVVMPCEIFDTREAFLMYCQNNHCQFDQLRRAKHSSMMVLYHLFNQGTTGFTFSCTNCKLALTSGNRWNCSICPVFNLCDNCKKSRRHEHPLHLFKVVSIPRLEPEISTDSQLSVTGMESSTVAVRTPKRDSERKRMRKDQKLSTIGTRTDNNGPATPPASGTAGAKGKSRKRKLTTISGENSEMISSKPMQTAVISSETQVFTNAGNVNSSIVTTHFANGSQSSYASVNGTNEDLNAANKKRRGAVDLHLLIQLDHASICTSPECTFTNCLRIRAMLRHGMSCEVRRTGPCITCKRIAGLLTAHARQCEKPETMCKVPRCGDIRRHFMQQAQQQLLAQAQKQLPVQSIQQSANEQSLQCITSDNSEHSKSRSNQH